MEYTVLDGDNMIAESCLKQWTTNRPSWVSLEDGVKIQTLERPSKSFMILGEITSILTLKNGLDQCVLKLRENRPDAIAGQQFFAHTNGCFQSVKPQVSDIIAFMNPFIVLRHSFKSSAPTYSLLCSKSCKFLFYFKQKNNSTHQVKVRKLHNFGDVHLPLVVSETSTQSVEGESPVGLRKNDQLKERILCGKQQQKCVPSVTSNSDQVSKKQTIGVKELSKQRAKEHLKTRQNDCQSSIENASQLANKKRHKVSNYHLEKDRENHGKLPKLCSSSVSGPSVTKKSKIEKVNTKVKERVQIENPENANSLSPVKTRSQLVAQNRKGKLDKNQPNFCSLSVACHSQQADGVACTEESDQHQQESQMSEKQRTFTRTKQDFQVISFKPEERGGDTLHWLSGCCERCKRAFPCSQDVDTNELTRVFCPACREKQLNIVFYVELLVCNASGDKFVLILQNEMAEEFFNCSVLDFISSRSLRLEKYNMLKGYCTSAKTSKSDEPPILSCFVLRLPNSKLIYVT